MKKTTSLILAVWLLLSVCGCQQAGTVQSSSVSPSSSSFSSEQLSSSEAVRPAEEATQSDSLFPRHEPYGAGVGAMPGRVVWSYGPDSVEWDGSGWWWKVEHFNEPVIQGMVSESIASLGGKETTAEGWDALFKAHNTSHGRGAAGYQRGEKIAIKANINGSGLNSDDTSGETDMSYTNPVLMKALLVSLVEEAGIPPEDITVYDVSRIFPDYMVEMCTQGDLAGIHFVGRNNSVPDEAAPIRWSYNVGGDTNYLPTCVTEAAYMINLANLKGHSYGMTLCGKNHFGSYINSNRMRPPVAANLHSFLAGAKMDEYSPLVDFMANEHLGGKTVLYMLDAIICAPTEGASITGNNSRWQQAPFNGDYTSSIFVSQDPVAIDSVGADFLANEPVIRSLHPGAEGYLHEEALVADAPSGTSYQNGNGQPVANLGVHEHWNNPVEKQYSRNLGAEEGIELIRVGTKTEEPAASGQESSGNSNVLIAYFSWADNAEPFAPSDIDVDVLGHASVVAPGDVGVIAQYIEDRVQADVFKIVVTEPYSYDYDETLNQGRNQRDSDERPALAATVENIADYDVIFLGFPNWWYTIPAAIHSFVEAHDLSGKTIIPFVTHGTGGLAGTIRDLTAALPDDCSVLQSYDVFEDDVFGAQAAVNDWLAKLGY